MIARLAGICALAAFGCTAPAFAEAERGVMYGPEVTGELEKFLPLEIGAADCWMATFPDGAASDMRFSLLVQGPGEYDEPGMFRYHYELEAKMREAGRPATAAGVCNSSEGGIICSSECDGGAGLISMLKNGDVSVRADDWRLRSCGADGEDMHLDGHYVLEAADCPALVPQSEWVD